MDKRFVFKDKLLVLRIHRLGHLPPALYASQILSENGFPLLVVEYENLREENLFVEGPVPRRRFPSPWARFLPRVMRSPLINLFMIFRLMFLFLREGKPKLIIAQGLHEQFVAWVLYKFLRVPFSVQVHEIFNKRDVKGFSRFYLGQEKRVMRSADFLIFPEITRSKIYASRYQLQCPLYVVPNSPRLRAMGESQDLRTRYRLPQDCLIMAYIGGIGQGNAFEPALEALEGIPNVHFLFWGWGDEAYLEELREKAKRFGVFERVRFLGELGEDKWDYLQGCDMSYCVYFPDKLRQKFQATASNKFMEALACAVPVISSGEKDFKEIVEVYDVGVCAKSFSSVDIGSAIKKLAQDEMSRKRKSQNARKLHEELFHYEKNFPPVMDKIREYGFTLSKPQAEPQSVAR